MKKFTSGLLIGLLIGLFTATTTFAMAGDAIKLIVNGKTLQCDVAPQVINGRTMVPAKYVAEALGATVVWDAVQNAVIITGQQNGGTPTDLSSTTAQTANTDNFIYGKDLHDKYGVKIMLLDSNGNNYRLTRDSISIDINPSECKTVNGKLYFPVSLVNQFIN